MRELRDYHRPSSAQEAVDIKKRYTSRAMYLGGGTDILVHRHRHIEVVIDIRHAGIGYVRSYPGAYVIGGGALLRDAEREVGHVADGMLGQAIRNTAPWLIRNAATLAGNIANASPAADSVPALLALDAELVLLDGAEERVSIEDVFVGPHQTNLGDRLIREIRIDAGADRKRGVFIKLARSKSDIAQVNLAVSLVHDRDVVRDVRIALGAVAPVPMRARGAELLLDGKIPSPELLREVAEHVKSEVRPISDWRASEAYRRRMCGVLVRRALERVVSRES